MNDDTKDKLVGWKIFLTLPAEHRSQIKVAALRAEQPLGVWALAALRAAAGISVDPPNQPIAALLPAQTADTKANGSFGALHRVDPQAYNIILGKLIRTYRRATPALSQAELAVGLETSTSTIARIEEGRTAPTFHLFLALADQFKCTPDALTGYVEDIAECVRAIGKTWLETDEGTSLAAMPGFAETVDLVLARDLKDAQRKRAELQ